MSAYQNIEPIPMLLFCPNCAEQHIDEPQPEKNWTNPPHRSHECQNCGWVWRPSDVPTTGVAAITTKGKNDNKHIAGAQFVTRELAIEIGRLRTLINTPHTDDFLKAVPLEAAHQIERWGTQQDEGKTPWDWFWLIGYLAQKAAQAASEGNDEKAKHHTISTAAAMLNWYRSLTGDDNTFRPGIEEPKGLGVEG